MAQAIQIETRPKQQGFTRLLARRTARRSSQALAFDRGRCAFDQSAAPVKPARKCPPHLGFAKGPVHVAHQAVDGWQLPLGELVFVETASVTRKQSLRGMQGDARKRAGYDFGRRTTCFGST
jgi:hypothetical protein